MKTIIRKYQETDFLTVREILLENFTLKKVASIANTSNQFALVAINDQEVVGFLQVQKLQDTIKGLDYYVVHYVCVKRKWQQQGIATSMFRFLTMMANTEKIAYIELTSKKERVFAHHLYESQGFKERLTTVFRKDLHS